MKKIIIICGICLLILSISVTGVYAYYELTKSDLQSPVVADSYGTMIDKEKANNIFEVNILGEKKNVKYKETFNLSNLSVDKRPDAYGTYDIYVDDTQNQYIYLYNTSKLCGFKKESVYGDFLPKDKAITEDSAKKLCDEFLSKLIPNSPVYLFDSIYYDEREAIYVVEYVSFIDGVKTDDKCILWVTATGELGSFSMFNNSRYLKYADIKINTKKIEEAFKEKMSKSNYKVTSKYVTLDENGAIVMAYDVYLLDQYTSQLIYIPIE